MTARFPQLIPVAMLVATILGAIAIIWHQQHSFGSLRADLAAEFNRTIIVLRTGIDPAETTPWDEINRVDTGLRAEIREMRTELRAEIGELEAEVSENGQRLARIEAVPGIGVADDPPE